MKEQRYNAVRRCIIELNAGERFCPKCDGKGMLPKYNTKCRVLYTPLQCNICLGTGKLDWIEEATGKSNKLPRSE